MYIVEIIHRSA